MARKFQVILILDINDIDKDEEKPLTESKIEDWTLEHFDGCDLADVSVQMVLEI
jgi:hypothetical protein